MTTSDMQLDSAGFPVMQDNAGFNPAAAALQMGLTQMSGQSPSAPFVAARGLARAAADAELGDGHCDPMTMPF